MSASSNLLSTAAVAGGHTRLLNNVLQANKQDLKWKEEPVEISHQQKTHYWHVTAIVDGHTVGSGSAPKLRVAKDRAARETLIILGKIEG